MTKESIYLQKLEAILSFKKNKIAAVVAQEALDYHSVKDFFEDLIQNGCISGMISPLIYYVDTHKFFEKHYREIEEIRDEYEEINGISITIKGDLKNHLAWFAFESVAYQIWNDLEQK